MAILFMGGEVGAFVPADSTATESTIALFGLSCFDSAFCRCALHANNGSYLNTPALGAQTDVYAHMDILSDTYPGFTLPMWYWLDGAGDQRIRMQFDIPNQQAVFGYYVSAAWVELGRFTLLLSGARQTIDVRTVCNTASGIFRVYVAGTLRLDVSYNFSALASVQKFQISGDSHGSYISQVVIATEPTIGMRLITRYPSGAGATSSWTGAYTDVDETVYSDADFINSASVNQVSTFAQTGPVIAGYTVRAVSVTARARCGASGPANLQLALRVSGTDYFSSSKALSVGYDAYVNVWETNPATAAAWVSTAVDAIQPGVKSIT